MARTRRPVPVVNYTIPKPPRKPAPEAAASPEPSKSPASQKTTVQASISKRAKKAVKSSAPTDEAYELTAIHEYMEAWNMSRSFSMLPPADALTFDDVQDHKKRNLYSRRLFLGGKGGISAYKVWAMLKRTNKGSMVAIIVKQTDARSEPETIITGDNWDDDIEVMYPFRVLIGKPSDLDQDTPSRPSNIALSTFQQCLDALILYYFLEGREIDSVRARGFEGVRMKLALKRTAGIISSVYAQYPGGVAAVPDTYTPDDLDKEVAPEQQQAVASVEQPPNMTVDNRPSRRRGHATDAANTRDRVGSFGLGPLKEKLMSAIRNFDLKSQSVESHGGTNQKDRKRTAEEPAKLISDTMKKIKSDFDAFDATAEAAIREFKAECKLKKLAMRASMLETLHKAAEDDLDSLFGSKDAENDE